ncbi:olfactory receptor 10W1 [Sarcophilus harrisii]|uniref:olfactory receptor 10W1 n=1 Tax=Sarcophilus harrisii TaxID=9305 RepID=UPI0002271714|nr:olfactory receptor 10W1 [Sarcophilus harrisii]
MTWVNQTLSTEFVFLAYPTHPELQVLVFLGISLVYTTILTGNILIVTAIQMEARLHTPMYYLLGSLSIVEIWYTATVVPHILVNTMKRHKAITFLGCATQMLFFIGLGSADCFLLAVMAYDRYVAICYPLQYPLIMTQKLCVNLVVACIAIGFILSLQLVVFIFCLPFCRSRSIEHFFCDVPPVMRLTCTHSRLPELSVLVAGTLAIAFPFFLIAISYALITIAILGIHSTSGRRRAFSTCSSHLMVVLLQYGCCMFMYLRPNSSYSPKKDQLLSLVYTLGTPLLNPVIYTLRNSEMKGALTKVLTRNVFSKKSCL